MTYALMRVSNVEGLPVQGESITFYPYCVRKSNNLDIQVVMLTLSGPWNDQKLNLGTYMS